VAVNEFKMNNVRKVLEVMVVGKHYFMSPECMTLLAVFLGQCEKTRTKRIFDGELIDDLWQIINNSFCMTTAMKHLHAQDPSLFDMAAFSLYFGPMGLADSHLFDIPLLHLDKSEFGMYGEAEMLALGTAAMAMGDREVLNVSPLFEPFPSIMRSADYAEAVKEYFEDDATCMMNMMIAKFFSATSEDVVAGDQLRLIYSSRPQLSVEFFHNRQSFLRPEGFVVFDVAPEKLALTDDFDGEGLLFANYPKEKFIQGKLVGDRLIVKGAKLLLVIKLQGETPLFSTNPFVTAGDMIVASYDEELGWKNELATEAFAANEGVREKFLVIAAMLNSKFSKNAIYMLVQ
jgi:hypothetical protein